MRSGGRRSTSPTSRSLAHLALIADETANNTVDALVYTTASSVELHINGARATPRHTVPEFVRALFEKVRLPAGATPSTPGLNFTAVSFRGDGGGTPWAVNTVEMPSAPSKIHLTLDFPHAGGAPLRANSDDVALLVASVVDAQGRLVRASHKTGVEVMFTLAEGHARVIGTGNGDTRAMTLTPLAMSGGRSAASRGPLSRREQQ